MPFVLLAYHGEIPGKLIIWAIALAIWAIKSAISVGKKTTAPAPVRRVAGSAPSIATVAGQKLARMMAAPRPAASPARRMVAPAARATAMRPAAAQEGVAPMPRSSQPSLIDARKIVAHPLIPTINSQTLRSQLIITEILGKPLALRD
jgi:hypothetical protein